MDLAQRVSINLGGQEQQEGLNILAKSSPGHETLMQEWTIVAILVYNPYAVQDGVVDFGITGALKFDC